MCDPLKSPEVEPSTLGSPESSLYVDALTPGERVANEKQKETAGDDEDEKRTVVEKAVVNGVLTEEPDHVNRMEGGKRKKLSMKRMG